MTTSTTYGARDHARAQVTAVDAPAAPQGVGHVVWAEHVAPDGYTNKVLARGTALRLANPEGAACAHVLLYHADQPWERLNVADTVKVQWNAYLGERQLLLSDQGRVLATMTSSTVGGADNQTTVGGADNQTTVGGADNQTTGTNHDALCGTSPTGRGLFTLAAAKHGLSQRDLPPSLSFFQGVRVLADGKLDFTGPSGGSVTLRTELPVVVLIANTAHPLDPAEDCSRLEVVAWRDRPTTPDDPLWTATPEGRRAFENTADYLTARGLA